MTNSMEKQAFGMAGSRFESGTTAVTGDFAVLHCVVDTVFSLLTDRLASTSGDVMTGFTFPAGTLLYGKFTAFTLTSGAVRAYNSFTIA